MPGVVELLLQKGASVTEADYVSSCTDFLFTVC